LAISAQSLKDRYRADGKSPELEKVGTGPGSHGRIGTTQFRQGVGIQEDGLGGHRDVLSLNFLESTNQHSSVCSWNIGKACRRKRENVIRTRRDVDVLAIVTSQQRQDLSFETAPATLGITRDSLAKTRRKADGSRNCGILGKG
jgi:hypothetical protein